MLKLVGSWMTKSIPFMESLDQMLSLTGGRGKVIRKNLRNLVRCLFAVVFGDDKDDVAFSFMIDVVQWERYVRRLSITHHCEVNTKRSMYLNLICPAPLS